MIYSIIIVHERVTERSSAYMLYSVDSCVVVMVLKSKSTSIVKACKLRQFDLHIGSKDSSHKISYSDKDRWLKF